MATLQNIKRRIGSIKSTQQVTRAMQMVSAAKLQKAQERIERARPYALKMRQVLGQMTAAVDRDIHPLLAVREIKKTAVIVVTSDRGLCGGFNANIVRKSLAVMDGFSDIECGVFAVGRKGRDQIRRTEKPILNEYINIFRELQFSNAQQIAGRIISMYLENELDKVEVVYNEFKSAVQQNVIVEQLLPIKSIEPDETAVKSDYLYEPEQDQLLDVLLPRHLNIQIWRILLESNAAEQGARMTAMENATENADEMIAKLTLLYNRTRQQKITNQITEIVGGAEALK